MVRVFLKIGLIPALKDDKVPQVPKGIPETVQVPVDQIHDEFIMEKCLLSDEIFGQTLINKKLQLFSQPCNDWHLKTPFWSSMKGARGP